MDEDGWGHAQATPSRTARGGVDVYLRGRSLQSGADEKSDGAAGWCRMRQRSSVPALGRSRQNGPKIQALTVSARILRLAHPQFGIMRVTGFDGIRRFSAAC